MFIFSIILILFSFYTLFKIIYLNNKISIYNSIFLLHFEVILKKNFLNFFSFSLNIISILFLVFFNYFNSIFIDISTALFYSTQTFCMENQDEVANFPIRNIVIDVSLNPNSSLVSLEGLLELTDEILNNRRISLLVESGSNRPLGILPGMYNLPCTNIKEEMLILTNRVINVLRSSEEIGGLSRPHFLEFLQNLNSTLDYLKYFTSTSFCKINEYHHQNFNAALNTTRSLLDIRGEFNFSLPIIAQFSYDYDIASFNWATMHFYSFLTLVETSTQQAIIDLESESNHNHINFSVNLLRISDNIAPVDMNIIIDRARLGDNYHFNMQDERSLTILRNNNFIIRDL